MVRGGHPRRCTRVLNGLVELLTVVQPLTLDRGRSHAVATGHGRHNHGVEFLLAHRDGEAADVIVAVGSDAALISRLLAHEHVYAADGNEDRPWTTVVVDAVAAVLRSEYEVRDHYRGRRLVKTSVHDTVRHGQCLSTSGSLFGLLPFLRRVDHVERRTLDFDCRQ